MRCLRADSCLCCISLKPAGITLGIVGIFLCNILDIITAIYNENNNKSISSYNIDTSYRLEHEVELKCFFCAIQIVTSTLWLMGIYKNKPKLMIPELIYSFFAVFLIGIIAALIWLHASTRMRQGAHLMALPLYLLAGLFFHFWIVRLSLYKSMIGNDRQFIRTYPDCELNEARTYIYTA